MTLLWLTKPARTTLMRANRDRIDLWSSGLDNAHCWIVTFAGVNIILPSSSSHLGCQRQARMIILVVFEPESISDYNLWVEGGVFD